MSIRRTEHAPLRNTFGVDARAGLLLTLDDSADLPGVFAALQADGVSPLVVGGGSNR